MGSVHIQWQDSSGWATTVVLEAPVGDPELQRALRSAQNMYPGKRIRAVDDQGRLLDLLG